MTIAIYQSLMHAECRACGRLPKVAVMGQFDFDELCGELSRDFGVLLRAKSAYREELQYQGIHIFKSYANKHGVWFGGSEV